MTEKIRMSFRDMMTNPPGKYTRQVAARYQIIQGLTASFREAVEDERRAKRFRLEVFRRSEGVFLAAVKVPSSKNDTDMDVIFELDYAEPEARVTNSALVRVYCNSPGWVFTYGYVAAKMGLVVPGFEALLGREVLRSPPRVTNPPQELGFDKVVYHAALFLIGRGGMLTLTDANALAEGTKARRVKEPSPSDDQLSAERKFKQYEGNDAKAAALRRRERAADSAAKEKARKALDREKRQQSKAINSARPTATAPSVRSVAATKSATTPGVSATKKSR